MFAKASRVGVVLLAAAVPAWSEPRVYGVEAARSVVTIRVGKAGLFKFAGHEHEVLAPSMKGEVRADREHLDRSSVVLTFEASGLRVSGKGEPPEDVPKVQAAMQGPQVLEVERFPEITFHSTKVAGRATSTGVYELTLGGELTLHGVKASLSVPVRVEITDERLTATGTLTMRHTAFGLTPISVAGVVKVKDELSVTFTIVAVHSGS